MGRGPWVPGPSAERSLIFEGSLISVWVWPQKLMIHHQMKAYCFGDEFRQALLKGTEAMEIHKATKWLSDNRVHGPLGPDDEQWAADHWFPLTKAAGWKHWAMVPPAKVLAQTNLGRIVKRYGDLGINARVFDDVDEAMIWLDSL